MIDETISQLPYIPVPINPATDYLELAQKDLSSTTGYTSTKSKISDLLSFVLPPSIGTNQIAYGSPVDGTITSSANLTYNDIITSLGLNYPGASIYLNNNSISDATDRLTFSKGNIYLGEYVGIPSISAIHMNVTPGANNYVLAGTTGGGTILNGASDVNYSVNNASKMIMNSVYSQHYTPLGIGALAPAGSQQFVVNGESYFKGLSISGADYLIRGQNSSGNEIFSVLNNGVSAHKSNLDGTGSGVDNMTHSLSITGGWRSSYRSTNGYGTYLDFFSSNVKNSYVYENQGYMNTAVNGVYGIINSNTAASKFFVDMLNNGYTGISQAYFVPSAQQHIKGLNALANSYAQKIEDNVGLNIIKCRNDGYVIQRAVNGAIPSVDLANGEFTLYGNEASNEMTWKWKKSDGTVLSFTQLFI